jgi:hypothetical protein
MCRGGVGSILVMFDVLDCYILYMCLLLFVYYLFWRLPGRGGRQNRIFLKKIYLCSSVTRGVDVAGRVYHVAVTLTNIRPTWHQGGCETTWCTFVGHKEPMNVRILGSSVLHG